MTRKLPGTRAPSEPTRIDLRQAEEVQRMLLPELPADLNGIHVCGTYVPAFEVGGDFYDVVSTTGGSVLAVVGDVLGKGVAAALTMSWISWEMRRAALDELPPSGVLARANAACWARSRTEQLVTATCIAIGGKRNEYLVASAGHPAPFVRRRSGEVIALDGEFGPPLGVERHTDYRDEAFPARPGDIVFLFTDGASDGDDGRGRSPSLQEIVGSAPHGADEALAAIVSQFPYAGSTDLRRDDVTILVLGLPDEAQRVAG